MPPVPKPSILEISAYQPGLSKSGNQKKLRKLSSNESLMGASPKAVEAYAKAAEKLFRYPEGSAAVLREAIGEIEGLDPARIICGAGSDEIISFLCQAYASKGDEVLYSQHGFLMYPIYARIAGATPVTAPENNKHADVDALLAAVTPRTKIVFLANPNNPTGTLLPKTEIARLRKGLPEQVLLVLDGAYAEFVDDAEYSDGRELVDAGENTVLTRTFSKIYGLSALRIGWGYFPAAIADIINRVRGPFNVSTPAMEAAAAAMRDVEFTKKVKRETLKERTRMENGLTALGLKVYPSAANFLLVEFPGGENQAVAADAFLMEEGIIPRRVAGYELPECLRITVGLSDDTDAILDALKRFLK